MNIEQIGLFIFGWFAVGFLVAVVLGKFIREADQLDDELSHATATSRASVNYLRQNKRKSKRQRRTKVTTARSEKNEKRATS